MTKLTFYNQSNAGKSHTGAPELRCTYSSGNITLTKVACSDMGLKAGDRVQIANDPEGGGGWFLCKSDKSDKDGFELLLSKPEEPKAGQSLRFSCKFLIGEMMKDLKRNTDERLVFNIDTEGKPRDGFVVYDLDPKMPLKAAKK
jgi:hypothetical protein